MPTRIAVTVASALLLMGGTACDRTATTAGEAGSSVALTHVTVIDGTGAEPKADQTVVITGERIAAIGSSESIKTPKGARVVDATGKYLIPGFWDLHVHTHFGTPEVLPVFVANGITGIRELDAPMPEIDRIRARASAGSLLTPRIVAAGKMIEAGPVKDILPRMGPPIITEFAMADRVFVNTVEEARAAVRELAALKPDVIKHHNAMRRDIFFAVLDEAKKAGLRVGGHFPMVEKVTMREVAESGQASIEHLGWPGVSGDWKAMTPAGRDSLTAIVKASGLAFVPTFVVGDFSKPAPANEDSIRLEQAHRDPRARFVTPQLWQAWDGMIQVIASMRKGGVVPPYDFATEREILRAFHKAGVPILPGTDFMVQFLFPGSSAQEEVVELVKQLGMTPHEAIQAASRRSAELVGVGAETGTIEAGKAADLILVDADPLADITNTQKIAGVARAGRFFDRAALDSLLNDAASRLKQAALSSAPSTR